MPAPLSRATLGGIVSGTRNKTSSFGGELRRVCKREKMGDMIESRKERRARRRTSMDWVGVASVSSGDVGEGGLFDLGVREDRDCIGLSV
jgi:hypothetical protein